MQFICIKACHETKNNKIVEWEELINIGFILRITPVKTGGSSILLGGTSHPLEQIYTRESVSELYKRIVSINQCSNQEA